jgi:hypothetical protein
MKYEVFDYAWFCGHMVLGQPCECRARKYIVVLMSVADTILVEWLLSKN